MNTLFRKVSPSLNAIDFHQIKDLWRLGLKFFLIQIQMIVLYQSTNVLISYIDGPESVTQYNIAYKVMNVVTMVFSIVLNPLWPAFTDAYARKDYFWMNNIYHKMCRFYLGVCAIIILMVLFSPLLYHLWIGNKVNVPMILTILVALYTLIHCWDSLQVMLINGIGTVKLQTYVTLFGLIMHIPLSLFLGQYMGMLGIIVSMCIINIIYSSFFTIQIRKILKKKAGGIWIK